MNHIKTMLCGNFIGIDNSAPAQSKVQRTIPLAASQTHIAFLCRYWSEAAAAFNEALIIRLSGQLDGPAIQAAIEEVGNRYEALRTALDPDVDSLNLLVGEALELVVSITIPSQVEQRLTENVVRPFKIGNRMFRTELLRIAEIEHILVLVGHLLVLEQQSLHVVMEDIAQLYRQFSLRENISASPAVLQWTDYLAMGETAEARAAHQRAEVYWKQVYAAGVPRLEPPGDFPRPAVKKDSGSRQAVELKPDLTRRIKQWAYQRAIDPSILLLACYAQFIGHWVAAAF